MNLKILIKHQDVLKTLAHCKPQIRKAILKNADKELIQVICHCVFNMLRGNINLSAFEKQKLKGYKKVLRNMVQKTTFKDKKKMLEQSGGFLQFLIPAAITGISSIISSIISSNSNQTNSE